MSKSIKSQEMSGLISNCFRAIENKDLQDLKSHMTKLISCYAEDEEDEISIWDAMNSSGETMLTLSCRLHLLDIVHYLVLDIGFNVNTPNAHNLYPIHTVCIQEPQDTGIIKIIATGLSKLSITERTQQDRFGNTALHFIAQ
jgi:ankyrin repeat protein